MPALFRAGLASHHHPEQFGIRAENRRRLVVEDLLVGFQRSQQFVESRILRIGGAVSARRLCIAFAFDLLGILVGAGEDFLFLAIGIGADFQRLLLALGSILPRDTFAFRAHASINALLALLRQIEPLDAH